MKVLGFALVSVVALAGCAGVVSLRDPPSMPAAREALAACCVPDLPEGPWVEAPSVNASQSCWACPEGGALACAFEETRLAADDGAVHVAGTLRCKMDRGSVRDVVIVAAQEAPEDPGRLRVLGQVRLDPRLDRGAVDPLPRWEDARLPFRLTLSDEGLPLDAGRRLVLFGVVTSEDGPAVVTAFRLDF